MIRFGYLPSGSLMGREDMLDAYATGRPALTDCRDNVYSIAMALASVESIHEKRGVGIEALDRAPCLILH